MAGDNDEKPKAKTIGQAIDAIIEALQDLDTPSRVSAIRAACDHLSVELPSTFEKQGDPVKGDTSSQGNNRGYTDIRALKEAKKPASVNEMAAIVAYYLQEIASSAEHQTSVGISDMEKYFKQANFPLPKVVPMILNNAKKAGYFESEGSGKFRLNPVGYNLVAHNLPRDSGQATAPYKARKKGKAKKAGRTNR